VENQHDHIVFYDRFGYLAKWNVRIHLPSREHIEDCEMKFCKNIDAATIAYVDYAYHYRTMSLNVFKSMNGFVLNHFDLLRLISLELEFVLAGQELSQIVF
jgi:hypothetical protein